MPSKNMIPKGKRRQTVKPAYRAHREAQREAEAAAAQRETEDAAPLGEVAQGEGSAAARTELRPAPDGPLPEIEFEEGTRSFVADESARGRRLDAYLALVLPEISRARAQLLIDHGQVQVNGVGEKASYKLLGGERIEIEGEPQPAPLKAEPEDIPLDVVYEDGDLVVINKPAGMTVHAGAGDAEHNRGTLVNALLFHFGRELSAEGGALRPGIVHRLDKETSGLILVAKNDQAHRKLAEMFANRTLKKTYLALVHGILAGEEGTVDLPIGRDPVRRTRMTARRTLAAGARAAVSHWRVLERIGAAAEAGTWGAFTLVEVQIETGRTHQIRVHLAALGHPVVGDTLYGAPPRLKRIAAPNVQTGRSETRRSKAVRGKTGEPSEPTLERNFLHAAALRLQHPRSRRVLNLHAPLPPELEQFLGKVRIASMTSREESVSVTLE